jgi:hypothetical protein
VWHSATTVLHSYVIGFVSAAVVAALWAWCTSNAHQSCMALIEDLHQKHLAQF